MQILDRASSASLNGKRSIEITSNQNSKRNQQKELYVTQSGKKTVSFCGEKLEFEIDRSATGKSIETTEIDTNKMITSNANEGKANDNLNWRKDHHRVLALEQTSFASSTPTTSTDFYSCETNGPEETSGEQLLKLSNASDKLACRESVTFLIGGVETK